MYFEEEYVILDKHDKQIQKCVYQFKILVLFTFKYLSFFLYE